MTFAFLTGDPLLWSGLLFGAVFGWLVHRGGVTDYDVIVNQFRFRDFTVLKIMLTAIVVGGVGVWALHGAGAANFHIKPGAMLAVLLGAAIFGVGMVLLGYCPGTGVAAMATGSVHAAVGVLGMLAGGAAYALSYDWIAAHVLKVWDIGKQRLPDVTGVPDAIWYAGLAVGALLVFVAVSRAERRRA
jgi:uncharacterized membrane protein YedE/YeeE